MRFALLLLVACRPVEGGTAAEAKPVTVAPEEEAPNERARAINRDYADRTDVEAWARSFEKEGREAKDHKADIVAAIGLKPGMDVADVGAGTGLFTFDFAKAVGASGSVKAVDVQDYFLAHIEATAEKRGVKNVAIVKATQKSVNLPRASVDVVFFCDAYHHIEYPRTYLRSVYEALRPGGRLVIVDYEAIPGKSKPWIVEHVRATPKQFRAEIEAAGFAFARSHDILEENFFFEFTRKPAS